MPEKRTFEQDWSKFETPGGTSVTLTPTGGGGMIRGGSPTIFINDMNRAVRFYSETLGLKIAYRSGDKFCMIDAGDGLMISLHPPADNAAPPGTNGATQVGLNVTQAIEQVVETLRTRGVKFNGPIVDDQGKVKLAFFNDPDGNMLYLCQVSW
jgi:catechol 2,3-dioxygenase-like lactoylglutathione lyase family enzyme